MEVEVVKAHSSLAVDDLEMIVLGYTVWDEYTIKVSVRYTMFDNSEVFFEANRCWNLCFGNLCRPGRDNNSAVLMGLFKQMTHGINASSQGGC